MKKLLLAFALLATTSLCKAQATTEQEYNYIQNTLKEVIKAGLDPKPGYFLKDVADYKTGNKNQITVKDLRRADSSIAGTFIQFADFWGTKTICMPSVNSDTKTSFGWPKFYSNLTALNNSQKEDLLRYMCYQSAMLQTKE